MEPDDQSITELSRHWAKTEGMRFFEKNVEAFVHAVLSDGAVPVLVPQCTLATARLPRSLRKRIAYHWIALDHANLVAVNEAMVEVLRTVADRHGVPFIDPCASMNGRPEYFRDHVHMNPDGSRMLARFLARALTPAISARVGAGSDQRHSSFLVGYWPCDRLVDGFVRDRGPHGLHGKARGGVRLAVGRPPTGHSIEEDNSALQLDGRTGEVVVEHSAALHLPRRFALTAWIKLDAAAWEKPSMGVIVKGGEYYLVLKKGYPAFRGYGLDPPRWYAADTRAPLQQWARLVARYDGSQLTLQIDDDVVLSQPASGNLQTINSPLTIGGLNGNFAGAIDEIRIEELP